MNVITFTANFTHQTYRADEFCCVKKILLLVAGAKLIVKIKSMTMMRSNNGMWNQAGSITASKQTSARGMQDVSS